MQVEIFSKLILLCSFDDDHAPIYIRIWVEFDLSLMACIDESFSGAHVRECVAIHVSPKAHVLRIQDYSFALFFQARATTYARHINHRRNLNIFGFSNSARQRAWAVQDFSSWIYVNNVTLSQFRLQTRRFYVREKEMNSMEWKDMEWTGMDYKEMEWNRGKGKEKKKRKGKGVTSEKRRQTNDRRRCILSSSQRCFP